MFFRAGLVKVGKVARLCSHARTRIWLRVPVSASSTHMVDSQNHGPHYRPQSLVILIVGTPKKDP